MWQTLTSVAVSPLRLRSTRNISVPHLTCMKDYRRESSNMPRGLLSHVFPSKRLFLRYMRVIYIKQVCAIARISLHELCPAEPTALAKRIGRRRAALSCDEYVYGFCTGQYIILIILFPVTQPDRQRAVFAHARQACPPVRLPEYVPVLPLCRTTHSSPYFKTVEVRWRWRRIRFR